MITFCFAIVQIYIKNVFERRVVLTNSKYAWIGNAIAFVVYVMYLLLAVQNQTGEWERMILLKFNKVLRAQLIVIIG